MGITSNQTMKAEQLFWICMNIMKKWIESDVTYVYPLIPLYTKALHSESTENTFRKKSLKSNNQWLYVKNSEKQDESM